MEKPERQHTDCAASLEDFNVLRSRISQNNYIEYLLEFNGGYYYSDSLELYPLSKNTSVNNLMLMNSFLMQCYGDIYGSLFAFSQDTFANQFCFDKSGAIVLFNIETGESEQIADSFLSWQNLLIDENEWLTGIVIREKFIRKKESSLPFANRLCPKTPFFIGGDYDIDNLYGMSTLKCIETNANIAKQIFYLPDNTSIVLKVVD